MLPKPARKANEPKPARGSSNAAIGSTGAAGAAAAGIQPASAVADPAGEADQGSDNESSDDEEEEAGWLVILPILAAMAYELAFEAIDSGGIQITIMFLLPIFVGLKNLFNSIMIRLRYGGNAPPPPPMAVGPPAMPPPPPPPDLVGTTIEALFAFAFDKPLLYFFLNFGVAAAIGTFFLFLQDIQNYFARRRAQAKMQSRQRAKHPEGYVPLEDGSPPTEEEAPPDLEAMKRELIRVTDQSEELEIKTKVYRKKSAAEAEARKQLKELHERREELKTLLGLGVAAPIKKPKEDKNKEPSCLTKFMKSTFMQFMQNAANGVMSVTLYFADLLSDIQVVQMLFDTGNQVWASISITILVAQFVVVYVRVIPYLSTTFGSDSTLYKYDHRLENIAGPPIRTRT